MKIALFHTTLPAANRKVGGVEVVVHRLANALVQDDGHDVTVFSLTESPANARYNHVQLFRGMPWLGSWSLARWLLLPLLLNAVSFRGYDVLHFHGDDWFFFRRSLPTIRTLHGSALQEARSAQSWRRSISQRLIYPLEQLAARLATVSLGIGPLTARLYPVQDLVNNGVDRTVFRPGSKATRPTILFVGTWEGRKRGHFLYKRFVTDVLPSIPDAHLQLVTDRISDAAREHPNVEHILFPTDEALAKLYRRAWVFAYPSTYEGFGLPYVEAMASGTAVICSPNDGAAHVLDHGQYGVVCDDKHFGTELETLLRDDQRRGLLETQGLERAKTFSWEAIADHHVQWYRRAAVPAALRSEEGQPSPASS